MSKSSRRDIRPPVSPVAGRPARVRRSTQPASFLQRNRTAVIGLVAAVVVGAAAIAAFAGASSPAWACSTVWTATATSEPVPDATPRIGYVQDDLGAGHIPPGQTQRYPVCPPASGKHSAAQGQGPIPARVYGPDDDARPQGWVHNLEHGGIVILYRCPGDACEESGQQQLRDLFATFPASPICGTPSGSGSPVIARFDEMSTPYSALLWNLILPLDSLDRDQIVAFWAQPGERTSPELGCARPTPTPAPSASPTLAPTPTPTSTPAPS